MDNCKHCGHPIVFLSGYWRHYHEKQGTERHGTARSRIECFSCECKDPELYEIKPSKINWRNKDGSSY